MEKQISIVVAASGEIKDIALSEGATVKEVLQEASLQGYQLSRKGGEVLAPDTDLYSEAMDSEKLYATPEDVSVGVGETTPTSGLQKLKNDVGDLLRMLVESVADVFRLFKDISIFDEVKKKEYALSVSGR